MTFSANLGFLWTDRTLPDAIRSAAAAGFDAVECHWPYEVPSAMVRDALDETGLPMLGLNTARGDVAAGENGLAALVGREAEAQRGIDQALRYTREIGAQAVHVMAGYAEGQAADRTFTENLERACVKAARDATTILIEPLNRHDAPGYFLKTTDQAIDLIDRIDAPNLKLMFDCYHVGRTEGDVTTRLKTLRPYIGHVQIAGVPDRGPPDRGELDYCAVMQTLRTLGWDRPVGAEYKPDGPTEATLAWLEKLR
ncbi:MAG: TIM barrel protein [Pseudomonadota bacterium]